MFLQVNIISCFSIIIILVSATDVPIVKTGNGLVEGVTKQYHGKNVLQFKKIPYAKPPIGHLRFEKPVRHQNWDSVLNATEFGPSCIQYLLQNDAWLLDNTEISEDCLHLNIYVPCAIDKSKPKAVMVWIHGGGFTAGQGSLFDGSYLALQGDVIVVTINYRLGLLGFLSTEDKNAVGNFGIWDQKMAIEWIHDNAEHFGGDRYRITIFGESAGGYSVGLHTIIPSNKGYFQRAISQSGAVISPRALASDSKRVAEEAGKLLNCSTSDTHVLIDCLKSKPASDILKVQSDAISGWDKTDTFVSRLGPVMDGHLIVGNPTDLLQDSNSDSYKFFQSLDIMAGTNNAEGGLMYWLMMKYQDRYHFNISDGIPKEVLCDVLATIASKSYFDNNNDVTQAICEQYSVSGMSMAEQGRSAVNVYADAQFIIPTIKTLLAHVHNHQTKSTYHYIFTHSPSFTWIQSRPHWLKGANHAGELPFVFGLEAMYPKSHDKPSSEMELSRQFMRYWSNFAKSGNPNSQDLPGWPLFDHVGRFYMNLTESPTSGQLLYNNRVNFWTVELPAIKSLLVNTTNGHIHGVVKYIKDSPVIQFKGIPYATPPTGRRRFRKPVPHSKWEGIYNANEFGPSCIQNIPASSLQYLKNKNISEDCLQLNIFVPRVVDLSVPKAVMIWIHGGGYVTGQGSIYDGSNLALRGNVIVVTVNYRLGILGFLSTEDGNALGNYGLWDQKTAIEWVYNNAGYFGGDKNRITIFGESAGGYSVGLQAIIAANKGYFQRVILQSGTALCPRALAMDSKRVATEAGNLLNCSSDTTLKLVDCLRQKSATDLLMIQDDAAYGWDKTENLAMRFGPVVDGDLINQNPTSLLEDKNSEGYKFYKSLDIIAGINNAEGGLMRSRMYKYQKVYNFNVSDGLPRAVLCDVIAPSIVNTYFNNNSQISRAICDMYSTSTKSLYEQSRCSLDAYADFFFMVPTYRFLSIHSDDNTTDSGKSYQYLFAHKPSYSNGLPPWFIGASHGQEIPFIFGLNTVERYSMVEANLSALMMTYWINFANTGNPNVDTNIDQETGNKPFWPKFNRQDKAFMNFTESSHSGSQLFPDRVKFWTETISNFVKSATDSPNYISSIHTTDKNSVFKTNGSIVMLMLTNLYLCYMNFDFD